eukprot:2139721-Prorocentrum_lima.AAC.1
MTSLLALLCGSGRPVTCRGFVDILMLAMLSSTLGALGPDASNVADVIQCPGGTISPSSGRISHEAGDRPRAEVYLFE